MNVRYLSRVESSLGSTALLEVRETLMQSTLRQSILFFSPRLCLQRFISAHFRRLFQQCPNGRAVIKSAVNSRRLNNLTPATPCWSDGLPLPNHTTAQLRRQSPVRRSHASALLWQASHSTNFLFFLFSSFFICIVFVLLVLFTSHLPRTIACLVAVAQAQPVA